MKVALLLTGQLRTFEFCKHIIKNMICNHYDTDTFISVDTTNTHQRRPCNSKEATSKDEIDSAISFLNPIDYTIFDDLNDIFKQYEEKIPTELFDLMYRRFRQYYVVMKAYDMLKRHIETTGTHYDLIIRLRFDQLIWNSGLTIEDYIPIVNEQVLMNETSIEKVKLFSQTSRLPLSLPSTANELVVLGFGVHNSFNYVNDQFFMHGPALIDVMANFYHELPELIADATLNNFPFLECIPEYLIYLFACKHNIDYKRGNINGIFVREFLE